MKLFTLNLEIDFEQWFKSFFAITDNKKKKKFYWYPLHANFLCERFNLYFVSQLLLYASTFLRKPKNGPITGHGEVLVAVCAPIRRVRTPLTPACALRKYALYLTAAYIFNAPIGTWWTRENAYLPQVIKQAWLCSRSVNLALKNIFALRIASSKKALRKSRFSMWQFTVDNRFLQILMSTFIRIKASTVYTNIVLLFFIVIFKSYFQ